MRIFISYRRKLSQDIADRLDERLVKKYGRKSVFKDVHSIPAGEDFRSIINAAVCRCDVLLALIAQEWAAVTDDQGRRLLDSENDPVRLEVETAIKAGIRIIPLRVNGAQMPREEELPGSLQALVYRNALPIRRDPDFERDMADLLGTLKTFESWSTMGTRTLAAAVTGIALLVTTAIAVPVYLWETKGTKTPTYSDPKRPEPKGETKSDPKPPEPKGETKSDPKPPEPKGETKSDPKQPEPKGETRSDPKQPESNPKTPEAPPRDVPIQTTLATEVELRKVEEAIECNDPKAARNLLRELKSRCASDPLLPYYDAVAVAKLNGWNGETESLIQEGQRLEQKGGLSADRKRLDPLLEPLMIYLSKPDKDRFQTLLGRPLKGVALPGVLK